MGKVAEKYVSLKEIEELLDIAKTYGIDMDIHGRRMPEPELMLDLAKKRNIVFKYEATIDNRRAYYTAEFGKIGDGRLVIFGPTLVNKNDRLSYVPSDLEGEE